MQRRLPSIKVRMDRFQEAFQQLDGCLLQRMHACRTPALSLALTNQDQTLHSAQFGFADLAGQTELRPDHLFAIGSIGKSFTAVVILQLHQQGLLDLYAPLQSILPWFQVKTIYQPITIHHLLTHSSGLPRGTDLSPDPRAEIYALRELETGFAPGARFHYSDLGYKILGLVIETITGKSYADNIDQRILQPLEMGDTVAYTTSALRPRMAAGMRPLYDDRPTANHHAFVPAEWVETNSADGCILSTAADMAKYARMLLNEGSAPDGTPLLNEAGFRRLVFPMIEDEGEAYSYGLYLFDDEGYRHAGHGGDVPGFESYLWLDLDNRLGTVVLMTQPYTQRASFIALEYLRTAWLGHRLPDPPPMPDFTHVIGAKEYAGVYTSPQHGTLRVEVEGSRLFLVSGVERVLLEERSPGRFLASHPDWDLFPLQFERGADGHVCEVFYGPRWYTNTRYHGAQDFTTPVDWPKYCGHYRAHNPWGSNFRVYIRKGQLLLAEPGGDEELLVSLRDGRFRIGEEPHLPERLQFDQIVDGMALRVVRSGCPYYRFFTP